ncbi:MAG: regulatory iron-sulfur-containing complex subunit RicT [Bacteroidia bacterium]
MGCSGCSSGRGCSTGIPGGCRNNGSCGTGGCNKLNVFDWLANMELPAGQKPFDIVEVRFKNSRKEFFKNVSDSVLAVGDIVAVEGSPGHDIGTVSLTGELVRTQLARRGAKEDDPAMKKIYRKAKQADIDKWIEAQALEQDTMIRSRQIALRLGLQMKISDVEYQGDKSKAIFYYTADERVDFRELIKILAEQFKVRIEMRQIGARQEAARLGGIGSCGRELCCSTWLTDFRSVTTGAARYQQLSLNPLKLAGQCGKLKCCLNYELDAYMDALKDFPDAVDIETKKGRARHQKTDIFRGIMWYSYLDEPDKFIPLSTSQVKEVIEMNKNGNRPEELIAVREAEVETEKEPDFENVVGQDSLTRFDRSKKNKKKKGPNKPGQKNVPQQQQKSAEQQSRPQQPRPQQQQQSKPQQQQQPQQGQGQPQQQKKHKHKGPRRDDRNKGQNPGAPPPISTPPPFV